MISSSASTTASAASSPPFLPGYEGYVSSGILAGGDVAFWEYPFLYIDLLLEIIQLKYDLPWWVVIGGTALALRVILSYFAFKQVETSIKMKAASVDVLKLKPSTDAMEHWATQSEIYKRHGVSMFRNTLYAFLQVPFLIGCFWAIRSLCIRPEFVDLTRGGTSWFTDLTAIDPYYIFPMLCSLFMLLTSEMFPRITGNTVGVVAKSAGRGFCLFWFWICSSFPMGVNIYWLVTSVSTFFFNSLFYSEKVREWAKLPPRVPKPKIINLSPAGPQASTTSTSSSSSQAPTTAPTTTATTTTTPAVASPPIINPKKLFKKKK